MNAVLEKAKKIREIMKDGGQMQKIADVIISKKMEEFRIFQTDFKKKLAVSTIEDAIAEANKMEEQKRKIAFKVISRKLREKGRTAEAAALERFAKIPPQSFTESLAES